ncbi:MAG: SPASM domain-containing protein [Candidatus Nealsonbacteria bacterium]|nr:SPASM domain-containing protein [Candidatus Nealsonbacteria bacterium]
MDQKLNIIPPSVKAGEKNWLKRWIKNNKSLYPLFYRLLRCNRDVFILRNFWINTDTLFSSVEIETCSICNRKCPFCPVAYDNSQKVIMSDEIFNKIITELKELNFKGEIAFAGYGEPLLDKRLEEFVKRIKKELGSSVEIVTNGDFLTYERFKQLISAGADTFRLSQHDKEPSEQIKEFFSNVQKNELKYIIFQTATEGSITFTNRGGSVKMKTLHPFYCAPMHLIIRADGSVPLCCNDYYEEVKLGNVTKQRIIDIWNKPFYREIRNEIKRGIFNLEICKKCLDLKPFEDRNI